MHAIEILQKTLNPIFKRYNAEKVIVAGADQDVGLNLYVIGCPRAKQAEIRDEVISALVKPTGIMMIHVEAEMMIDTQVRMAGELLYERKCA